MSIYTFYALFATEKSQIPKPRKALTLDVPEEISGNSSAYEYGSCVVDLSRYFSSDSSLNPPELPFPGFDLRGFPDPGMPGGPVPAFPKRSDFPEGEEGDTLYAAALDQYNSWKGSYEEKLTWDAWQLFDKWFNGVLNEPTSRPDEPDDSNYGTQQYSDAKTEFLAYQILEALAFQQLSEENLEWFDEFVWVAAANNRKRREYRKDMREYNQAVWEAQHNKSREDSALAKSASRNRSENKKTEQQLIQKSTQQSKSLEKRLIAKMAQRWAASNAQRNKQSSKKKD